MSINVRAADALPNGDSFYFVGALDYIHEFDAENGAWIFRDEKLTIDVGHQDAFYLPLEAIQCCPN